MQTQVSRFGTVLGELMEDRDMAPGELIAAMDSDRPGWLDADCLREMMETPDVERETRPRVIPVLVRALSLDDEEAMRLRWAYYLGRQKGLEG